MSTSMNIHGIKSAFAKSMTSEGHYWVEIEFYAGEDNHNLTLFFDRETFEESRPTLPAELAQAINQVMGVEVVS